MAKPHHRVTAFKRGYAAAMAQRARQERRDRGCPVRLIDLNKAKSVDRAACRAIEGRSATSDRAIVHGWGVFW